MGAFGEKLRNQREQRGIALDAISNATKISTRMLRAIEDERFDLLPGGVFNKGFIRAYARQVGLEEEETISDYLAALRESQIQAQTVAPVFRNPAGKPAPRFDRPEAPRPPQFPGSGFPDNGHHDPRESNEPPEFNSRHNHDRVLDDHRIGEQHSNDRPGNDRPDDDRPDNDRRAAGRRAADRRNQEDFPSSVAPPSLPLRILPDSAPAPSLDNSSSPVPWTKLSAALLLLTLALALWSTRRHRSVVASQPPGPAHSTTVPAPQPAPTQSSSKQPPRATSIPPAPINTAANFNPQTALPAAPPKTSSTPKPVANLSADDDDTAPAANIPVRAAAKVPATFTLLIRAEETSWISIVADGQPVAHETLIAPAETSVRATHEIVVRAGNAPGISFLLNGAEIPASGNPGEVKLYIFDNTGLKSSATVPPSNSAH